MKQTVRNTPYSNTIGHVLVTSPETFVVLHIPVYFSLTESPQARQLSKAVPFQTGIQTPSILWLHHVEKMASNVIKERKCRAHVHSQILLFRNNLPHFCSDYCPELGTWLHLTVRAQATFLCAQEGKESCMRRASVSLCRYHKPPVWLLRVDKDA